MWIALLLSLSVSQSAHAAIPLKLDPALSSSEKQLLLEDLAQMSQSQLETKAGSYFDVIFGGTKADALEGYLEQRVHAIIPESVSFESRIHDDFIHRIRPDQFRSLARPNITDNDDDDGELYTMATNIGTLVWFEALLKAPQACHFKLGDEELPIQSSRVGIVQLGKGYTVQKDGVYRFPQLARIATLIHEARHSDCTGGLHRSDLNSLLAGEDPARRDCGHLHVRCPEGHEYEGAYACDADPWGAYSVQAVYGAVMMNCSNCTDEQKNLARMVAADSLSRVIPMQDMVDGKLGAPDMSSSTELFED